MDEQASLFEAIKAFGCFHGDQGSGGIANARLEECNRFFTATTSGKNFRRLQFRDGVEQHSPGWEQARHREVSVKNFIFLLERLRGVALALASIEQLRTQE